MVSVSIIDRVYAWVLCVFEWVCVDCNIRGNCIMLALRLGMEGWPALPTLSKQTFWPQLTASTHTYKRLATSWHLSGHWHVLPWELVRRRRQCKHFVKVTFPLWTKAKVMFYPWKAHNTHPCHTWRCQHTNPYPPWYGRSFMTLGSFVWSVFLAFMLHSWEWLEIREREVEGLKVRTWTLNGARH